MFTIKTAMSVFNTNYDQLEQIPFNPEWANGTDYYDGAVLGEDAPKVAVGEMVASRSPEPNNRRIIIVGTPLGNLVVFERYTGGQHGVFVFNCSTAFQRLIGSRVENSLTADNMTLFLGEGTSWGPTNVGKWLVKAQKELSTYNEVTGR